MLQSFFQRETLLDKQETADCKQGSNQAIRQCTV